MYAFLLRKIFGPKIWSCKISSLLFGKRKNDRFFVILARYMSVINVGHSFGGPEFC